MSVAETKPNFDVLMTPIILELKRLEHGIDLTIDGSTYANLKFFVIAGVFDKPARSAILNTTTSTGFFGCIKCYQKGETIQSTLFMMLGHGFCLS